MDLGTLSLIATQVPCSFSLSDAVQLVGGVLEIFLSPLGHAYSLDICTVIDAYAAD